MPVNPERVVFGVVLALAAYASNFRSLIFWELHPGFGDFPDQASIEMAYWLLAALLVLWLLLQEGNLRNYWQNWRRQPWPIAFLLICSLSLFWSSDPAVSFHRASILIASTWVAAYIGMRCDVEEFLHYLSWFGALVALAAAYMALTDPLFGIDRAYGPAVWRGVFWNKNHLGSVIALFSAVLLLTLVNIRSRPGHGPTAWFILAYAGSLTVVYKSHSAAGYLLVLILHATVFLSLLWIALAERMQRWHYILAAIAAIAVILVALANLNAILGAFNRDITLTGRTKLWAYLLEEVVSKRMLLGYGFGSLWEDSQFRALANEKLGFYPVIGDNGFMDILLGVGAVGLAAFMLVYFTALKGAIRCLVREKNVAGCLPLLIMSFALFSNISFSLLVEIEAMVWGLIVAVLFTTAKRAETFCCAEGAPLNTRLASRSP
ncbi:MAG: hypothetical protein NTV11_01000 [Rhodocyclales bacterium]|nr:hypothetical protein [Rhodocyclales bacterium]